MVVVRLTVKMFHPSELESMNAPVVAFSEKSTNITVLLLRHKDDSCSKNVNTKFVGKLETYALAKFENFWMYRLRVMNV